MKSLLNPQAMAACDLVANRHDAAVRAGVRALSDALLKEDERRVEAEFEAHAGRSGHGHWPRIRKALPGDVVKGVAG